VTTLERALAWFLQPPTGREAPRQSREVTCAAVLGRPGEAEPVAAALALTLARHARARAATVALFAPRPATPDPPPPAIATPSGGWAAPSAAAGRPVRDASPPTPEGEAHAGGSRAARRLASRLAAHGLTVRSRGRLAWVALPAEGAAAAARRAIVAGAPAVLALTAPRTAALEPVLAEQDLLVLVTPDPLGPLARLAALAAHEPPLVVTRPLRRGLPRALACAGLAASREVAALLTAAPAEGEAA
jgi:hypothetical protein